jgi:hypothetical protein
MSRRSRLSSWTDGAVGWRLSPRVHAVSSSKPAGSASALLPLLVPVLGADVLEGIVVAVRSRMLLSLQLLRGVSTVKSISVGTSGRVEVLEGDVVVAVTSLSVCM